MEIAALVDASTKTSSSDWQTILNVASTAAGHFSIRQNCARWAVISYADTAQESIRLTAHTSLQSLQPAIRSLRLINGGSNLLSALQLLRTQVFGYSIIRTRATLVAMFVTDELSSCSNQLVTEAHNVRTLGVVIVGIVLTSRQTVNINCVRQIVTGSLYYEITDNTQYTNIVSQAAQGACPSDYWSKRSARSVTKTSFYKINKY